MMGYNLMEQDESMCALVRANVETWCNTRSGVRTKVCSPVSSTISDPPGISIPLRLFIFPSDIQRVVMDDKQCLHLNCAVSGAVHRLLVNANSSVDYVKAMITERLHDNTRQPKPLELDFSQVDHIIITPLPPQFQVLHRTPLRQLLLRRSRDQRLRSVEEDGWCHVPMYLRPPENQGRSRRRSNQLLDLFRVVLPPDLVSNNRFLPLSDVVMEIEEKVDEEKTDEQLPVVPTTTCPIRSSTVSVASGHLVCLHLQIRCAVPARR